jgi:HEAT repeat protein
MNLNSQIRNLFTLGISTLILIGANPLVAHSTTSTLYPSFNDEADSYPPLDNQCPDLQIKEQTKYLKSLAIEYRIRAWYLLSACGSKTLPILVKTSRDLGGYPIYMLNRGEKSVSDPVLLALGMSGKVSVPTLVEFIKNNEESLNTTAAVVALGQIGSEAKEAIPVLLRMEESGRDMNISGYRAIDWALKQIIDKNDVPTLIVALQDEDSNVRERAGSALCVLKNLGSSANLFVPILIRKIQDPNYTVNQCAITALGRIGKDADAAVPHLISILQKERITPDFRDPRPTAIEALGNIGISAQDAVPILTDMLKDQDLGLSAALALRKIQGETKNTIFILKATTSTEIKRLDQEKWEMPMVGTGGFRRSYNRSADVLTHIGKDAVPDLIKTLNNSSSLSARYYAAIVLGNIGHDAEESIPSLIAALKNPNQKVHYRAAVALSQIGSASAPELIKALQEKNDRLRQGAIYALWSMEHLPIDAVKPLKEILEDEKNPLTVRRLAAIALVKLGVDMQQFFTEFKIIPPSNAVCPVAKSTKGVAIPKFDVYSGKCVLMDAVYGGPASGGPGMFSSIIHWLRGGR